MLFWTYLRAHRRLLVLALVLAAINQIFSLLDPQILRLVIDKYATKVGTMPQREFIAGVALLLAGFVGVAFVSRVAKNFQDYFVNVISQRVGTGMYARGVEHSLSLPYAVFEDQRSGELLLKLQKARTDTQAAIQSFVNVVFLSMVGIVFVLAYAVVVHWTVGLALAVTMPALALLTFLISRRIKAAQSRIVRETADLAGSTTETLRNIELVKSLGLEEQEIRRLNAVNDTILGLELRKIRLIRKLSFLQGTLINATRAGLLFLLLWLISKGAITLGEFMTLFIYSFFVFSPLGSLGDIAAQYQEARASNEALEAVLRQKAARKPKSPVAVGPLSDIAFEGVSFTYAAAGIPSVTDISLRIASGQSVAFVGPSGSGKTTLVKLLVGLYEPTSGRLLFGGHDARTIDYDQLRARIGLVSQETQLFAGTVRENLTFVSPKAKDEDCLRVLRQAQVTTILDRGGLGLDTRIGEGGIKLSGGERQRLAIARALLRNPDLIIFDEATSSLDSLTERAITATIGDILAGRPRLITVTIAHRLSTVAHANAIHVLEKGRVVESGTHEALLAKRGLYAALWREQSAEAANSAPRDPWHDAGPRTSPVH